MHRRGNSWRKPIHARKGNSLRCAPTAQRIRKEIFMKDYLTPDLMLGAYDELTPEMLHGMGSRN